MATEQELKAALIKAHRAGDTRAAELFARKIKEMSSGATTSVDDGTPRLSINENPAQALPQQDRGFINKVAGTIAAPVELGMSLGSGLLSSAQGLGTGIVDAVTSGQLSEGKGPQIIEDTLRRYSEAGTYQPRTEEGRKLVQGVGEALGALPPVMGAATPAQAVGVTQAAGRTAQALGVRAPELPKPTIRQGSEQALQFAEENRLPLTTSDVSPPTSGIGRSLQVLGEQTPVVGTGTLRGAQQEARKGLIQTLKDETPEISDETLSSNLISSVNSYKRAIGKRYENINNQMQGKPVALNRTIDAIDKELMELSKDAQVKDTATIEKLFALREDLTTGVPDFQTARNNRTYMRESLKTDSDKPSTQASRVIDRVYNAMTEDIQEAVKLGVGEDAAFKLKQADKLFANEINTQKKTKLKNALMKGDVRPEEATKVLFSNNPSDVRELYSALDNNGRRNARAAIINKMLEKAEGESPEKFLSAANKYKAQYSTFFKGEERAKLDGMIAYLEATRRAAKAVADTPTGIRNIPVIIFGGVGADLFSGGGAVSGTVGTLSGLARLYESKPVRNALIRLSKTKRSDPNYEQLYLATDAAIKAEAIKQQEQGNE